MTGLPDIRKVLLDVLRRDAGDEIADQVEAAVKTHPDATWGDSQGCGMEWEYVAQDEWLDDGCEIVSEKPCDRCASQHGRVFLTWDEAMVILPDGGPNPHCAADNCYCRIDPKSQRGNANPGDTGPNN